MSLPESKRSAAEPQPNCGTAILAVSVTGGTPMDRGRLPVPQRGAPLVGVRKSPLPMRKAGTRPPLHLPIAPVRTAPEVV
jgi:hypothetical protein